MNKFNPNSLNNCVSFLDYSFCDEYLASVYENGHVNVFGMKTGVKLNKLTFDDKSMATVARFHPTKKLQLAMGFANGAVSVFDLQTKRSYFKSIDDHETICRDVCMSPVHPDCLITAGYDSVIKIFDLRKQLQAYQIKQNHPLSSISLSDCGNYCCAGDLKGEVTCYDFRNIKEVLNSKRVTDGNISRVAFVPSCENGDVSFTFTNETASAPRLSLIENIDRSLLSTTNTLPNKRDSFWDDIVSFHQQQGPTSSKGNQQTRISTVSRLSTDSRLSMGMNGPNFISLLDSSHEASSMEEAERLCDIAVRKAEPSKVKVAKMHLIKHLPPADVLEEINEENLSVEENINHPLMEIVNCGGGGGGDNNKENISAIKEDIDGFLKLPANQNSTPNFLKLKPPPFNENNEILFAQIAAMREEMNEQFKQLNSYHKKVENEIKFQLEDTRMKVHIQNFDLWKQTDDRLEVVTNGIGLLLEDDPFYIDYVNTKRENEELKRENEELKKRILSLQQSY